MPLSKARMRDRKRQDRFDQASVKPTELPSLVKPIEAPSSVEPYPFKPTWTLRLTVPPGCVKPESNLTTAPSVPKSLGQNVRPNVQLVSNPVRPVRPLAAFTKEEASTAAISAKMKASLVDPTPSGPFPVRPIPQDVRPKLDPVQDASPGGHVTPIGVACPPSNKGGMSSQRPLNAPGDFEKALLELRLLSTARQASLDQTLQNVKKLNRRVAKMGFERVATAQEVDADGVPIPGEV